VIAGFEEKNVVDSAARLRKRKKVFDLRPHRKNERRLSRKKKRGRGGITLFSTGRYI